MLVAWAAAGSPLAETGRSGEGTRCSRTPPGRGLSDDDDDCGTALPPRGLGEIARDPPAVVGPCGGETAGPLSGGTKEEAGVGALGWTDDGAGGGRDAKEEVDEEDEDDGSAAEPMPNLITNIAEKHGCL